MTAPPGCSEAHYRGRMASPILAHPRTTGLQTDPTEYHRLSPARRRPTRRRGGPRRWSSTGGHKELAHRAGQAAETANQSSLQTTCHRTVIAAARPPEVQVWDLRPCPRCAPDRLNCMSRPCQDPMANSAVHSNTEETESFLTHPAKYGTMTTWTPAMCAGARNSN